MLHSVGYAKIYKVTSDEKFLEGDLSLIDVSPPVARYNIFKHFANI